MWVVKATAGGSMSGFTGRRFQGIHFDQVTVNGTPANVVSGFGRFVKDGNWFFDLFRFNKAARKTWARETLETLDKEYNPAIYQYTTWVINGRFSYETTLQNLQIQCRAVNNDYNKLVNEFNSALRSDNFSKVKRAQINGSLFAENVDGDIKKISDDVCQVQQTADHQLDASALVTVRSVAASLKHAKMLLQKRKLIEQSIERLKAMPEEEKIFFTSSQGAKANIDDPYLNVYACSRQVHPQYQHEFNQHEKLDHEAVAYGMELLNGISDIALRNEQEFLDGQGFYFATSLTREFKREYGFYLADKKDEVAKEKQALAETAFNRIVGNGVGEGLTNTLLEKYEQFINQNGDFSVHLVERKDLPRVIKQLQVRLKKIGQHNDRQAGYPLTLLLKRLQSHQGDLVARIAQAETNPSSSLALLWEAYQSENQQVGRVPLKNLLTDSELLRSFQSYLKQELTAREDELTQVRKRWFRSIFDFFPFITNRQKPIQTKIQSIKVLLEEVDFSLTQSEGQRSSKYVKVVADHEYVKGFVKACNSSVSKAARLYSARLVFLLDDAELGGNKRFFESFYREYIAFIKKSNELIGTGEKIKKLVSEICKVHIDSSSSSEDQGRKRRQFFDLVREIHAVNSKVIDDFLKSDKIARNISSQAATGTHDQFVNYYDELGRLVKNNAPTLAEQTQWARDALEDEFFSLIAHSGVTIHNIATFEKTIARIKHNNRNSPDKLKLIEFYEKIIKGNAFDETFNLGDENVPADLSALGCGDFKDKLARHGGTQNIMQVLVEKFTKVMLVDLKREPARAVDFEGERGEKLDAYVALLGRYGNAGWGYYSRVEMLKPGAIVPVSFQKDTCLLELKQSGSQDPEVVVYWIAVDNTQHSATIKQSELQGLSLPQAGSTSSDSALIKKIVGLCGCAAVVTSEDAELATTALKEFLHALFVIPQGLNEAAITEFLQIQDLRDPNQPCQKLVQKFVPRLGIGLGDSKIMKVFDGRFQNDMSVKLPQCFTTARYREKLTFLTDIYVNALEQAVGDSTTMLLSANSVLQAYSVLFDVIFSSAQKSRVAKVYFTKLFGDRMEVSLKKWSGEELYKYYQLDRGSMEGVVSQVIYRYINTFPKKDWNTALSCDTDVQSDQCWWNAETAITILKVGSPDNIADYTAQRIREILQIEKNHPAKAFQSAQLLCQLLDSEGLQGCEKIRNSKVINDLLQDELSIQWTQASDYLCSTILNSNESKIILQNSRISKIDSFLQETTALLPTTKLFSSFSELESFIRYLERSADKGVDFADSFIVSMENKSAARLTQLFEQFITDTLVPKGVVAFVSKSPQTSKALADYISSLDPRQRQTYQFQLKVAVQLASQFDATKKCLDNILLHDLNRVLLDEQTAYVFIKNANEYGYLTDTVDTERNRAAWENFNFFLRSCLLVNPRQSELSFKNFRPYNNDVRGMNINTGLGVVIYHYLGTPPQLECADIYTISYISYLIETCEADKIESLVNNLKLSYPQFADVNARPDSAKVLNDMLVSQFHFPSDANESYKPGLYAFTDVKSAIAFKYGNEHTKKIALLAKIATLFDEAAKLDLSDPKNESHMIRKIEEFKKFCLDHKLNIINLKSYIGSGTPEEAYLRKMFDYYINETSSPSYSPLITLLTDELIEKDYVESGSQHNREGEKDWLQLCRLKHLKHYYSNALDLDLQKANQLKQRNMTQAELADVDSQRSYLEFQQAAVSQKEGLPTIDGTHTLANSWAYFGRQNVTEGGNPSLSDYGLLSVEAILKRYIDGVQNTPTESDRMEQYSAFDHFRLTLILAVQDIFTSVDYFKANWGSCSQNFKHSAVIPGIKKQFLACLAEEKLELAMESYLKLLSLAVEKNVDTRESYTLKLKKLASGWLLEFIKEQVAAAISPELKLLQRDICEILPTALDEIDNFSCKLDQLKGYFSVLSKHAAFSYTLRSILRKIEDQKGYHYVYMLIPEIDCLPTKPIPKNQLHLIEYKDLSGRRTNLKGFYTNSKGAIEEVSFVGDQLDSFRHIPLPKPGEWFKSENQVDPIIEKFGLHRQQIMDRDFILTKEFQDRFKKSEANAISERFAYYRKAFPSKLKIEDTFFDHTLNKFFNGAKLLSSIDLKKIFLPLIPRDYSSCEQDIADAIDSLINDVSGLREIDDFSFLMNQDRLSPDQRKLLTGHLEKFYQTVLKSKAEALRFKKLMQAVDSSGTVFTFLSQLIQKPGVFFAAEDIKFYGAELINQKIGEVLKVLGGNVKAVNDTRLPSLKEFYKKLLESKKKACEARLTFLANQYNCEQQLVNSSSDYTKNREGLVAKAYDAKHRAAQEELRYIQELHLQLDQELAVSDRLMLLDHFSQLLVEHLAAHVVSDSDFLKQRVRMIQRSLASLNNINEKQVIEASLRNLMDAPWMEPLLDLDNVRTEAYVLINQIDRINNLYQQIEDETKCGETQVTCFVTHDESYRLILQFNASRKHALVSRAGLLAQAIEKAESSGNHRRAQHLKELNAFISSDDTSQIYKLAEQEQYTKEYGKKLAEIDLIIANIFSTSCSKLNIQDFLIALERAEALNAGYNIFLSEQELRKYPNIRRVIDFRADDVRSDTSDIIKHMQDCLVMPVANRLGAKQYLQMVASFDTKLSQMLEVNCNNTFVPISDYELAFLTVKQRNLHQTLCLLQKLDNNDVESGDLEELSSLLLENSISYLGSRHHIMNKFPNFKLNQNDLVTNTIESIANYREYSNDEHPNKKVPTLMSSAKCLMLLGYLSYQGIEQKISAYISTVNPRDSDAVTALTAALTELRQFEITRCLSVIESLQKRAQEGLVRNEDDCSEWINAYKFLKHYAPGSVDFNKASRILGQDLIQALTASAPNICEKIDDLIPHFPPNGLIPRPIRPSVSSLSDLASGFQSPTSPTPCTASALSVSVRTSVRSTDGAATTPAAQQKQTQRWWGGLFRSSSAKGSPDLNNASLDSALVLPRAPETKL